MFWAKTITGRPIPLDAEPVMDGNIVIRHGLAVVIRHGVALIGQTPEPGEARHVSHFVSCPHSRGWRKRTGQTVMEMGR